MNTNFEKSVSNSDTNTGTRSILSSNRLSLAILGVAAIVSAINLRANETVDPQQSADTLTHLQPIPFPEADDWEAYEGSEKYDAVFSVYDNLHRNIRSLVTNSTSTRSDSEQKFHHRSTRTATITEAEIPSVMKNGKPYRLQYKRVVCVSSSNLARQCANRHFPDHPVSGQPSGATFITITSSKYRGVLVYNGEAIELQIFNLASPKREHNKLLPNETAWVKQVVDPERFDYEADDEHVTALAEHNVPLLERHLREIAAGVQTLVDAKKRREKAARDKAARDF